MSDIRRREGAKGVTYQVRYPCSSTKSGYAYETFRTRKEALAFREDALAKRRAATRHRSIRNVSQAVDFWLNICEKEGRNGRDPVTKGTLADYTERANVIKAYDWPKNLPDLVRADTLEFRSWLLEHKTRDQAKKVLSSFHSVILEMIAREVIHQDIAFNCGLKSRSRYDEPVAIPSKKDVCELLKAADSLANSKDMRVQQAWERYRPMLHLAVDTGMRPQEYVVAAKSGLSDGRLRVDRALERGGDISVTKTQSGRRTLDLSPATFDMVSHYACHHAAKNSHDLIFPTDNGKWQSTGNWRRRGFAAACEKACLMEDHEEEDGTKSTRPTLKPYDLRHFYASLLIDQGINIKRIMYLMGHADVQTTIDVYGHLLERADREQEVRYSAIDRLST